MQYQSEITDTKMWNEDELRDLILYAKELQRMYYLKWDGRLSVDGRRWYNSLMERQIV